MGKAEKKLAKWIQESVPQKTLKGWAEERALRDQQDARFAAQYAHDPWAPLTDILDRLAADSVIDRGLREELQDALGYVWRHGRADALDSLVIGFRLPDGSDELEQERRLLA